MSTKKKLQSARLREFTRGGRWTCYKARGQASGAAGLGEPGILNGEGGKPKRMRWRAFDHLTAEHDAFVGESLRVMALRFGIKF
jgi:hypothetical protein